MEMENKKQKIAFRLIILSTFCFLVSISFANAATLYFSPSSGSYAVGDNLSVSVYVSSADQALNAASGVISFPQDKLEVVSLSKSGSIFSLWVQEPSFSNNAGTINFEGIVLNPGFIGSGGKIITANFKVKAAGTAQLSFFSGSVLANDGKGTNILANLGNANFSLNTASVGLQATQATTPSVVFGAPSAPQISSSTHPDPDKWYAKKDAKFAWVLSDDVTGVRLLANKIPTAIPSVIYEPAISEKEVANLDDGIWYFHVQLRNTSGWGGISHFRFQIDTEKPQLFETEIDNGGDFTNPNPILHFKAIDYISGIEYYEVKIGEKEDIIPVKVARTVVSNPYKLPLQLPGKNTILVKAVDAANNETLSALDIIIKPLEMPVITEYPREPASGEIFIIKGDSYPNSQVIIWLQKEKNDPKSFTVRSGQDGKFIFTADEKLEGGIYQLWAEVIDARGARSLPSEKITIAVARSLIFRIGSWVISFLSVIIPLVALIIAFLIIFWYSWHKFSFLKKQLQKEVSEAESVLHKAFNLLKEDIREQIEMLEKTRMRRKLTKEEEKIIEQLNENLDDAEKFIRKEIKDIEKAAK